jgi:hypothetical protein
MLFTLMTAGLVLTGFSRGDDPFKGQQTEAAKTEKTKLVGKKVTMEELGQMLEIMGYELKPFKDKDGRPMTDKEGKPVGYVFTIKSGTWTIPCEVSLSGSKENIWFCSVLVTLSEGSPVPTEAILAMLESNGPTYPNYLCYNRSAKSVEFNFLLKNGTVTVATLREAIDGYTTAVKDLVNTWKKAGAEAEQRKAKENDKQKAGDNPLARDADATSDVGTKD